MKKGTLRQQLDELADFMVARKVLQMKTPNGFELTLAGAIAWQEPLNVPKKDAGLPKIDKKNPLRGQRKETREQLNGEDIEEDLLYAHVEDNGDAFGN